MKRMLVAACVALTAAMLCTAPAWAKTKKADKPEGAEKTLKGEIVSVTAATEEGGESQIAVETGNKRQSHEVSVTLNSETAITQAGHAIKAADLKAGDHVVISPATGAAKTVKVSASKQAKAEKKAKKKKDEDQSSNSQQ